MSGEAAREIEPLAGGLNPVEPPRWKSRSSLRRSRGFSLLVAATSTVIAFSLVGWVIVNSAGWPAVQQSFFDADTFADSFPRIARAFLVNVQIFLIAEVAILAFALTLAVMRSLREPVLAPLRLFAIAYIDFFRGVPSILFIFLLGFGIPALELPGVTSDEFFWGLVALVLVWSAYVAEVYRAGIESVHPSQDAAARSLGLSGFQSLRYVVLPQAVRRVVPPLMNDFIGLQKDSAFVAFLGPIEAFRRAQIEVAATFDFTPYLATAVLFLAITIPMTRLVDWLIERDRRRTLAGIR